MAREERWNHGGLWGRVRSAESRGLAEARGIVEAGQSSRKTRQSALTYSRCYELARKLGDRESAEAIDAKMRKLSEHHTTVEVEGRPQKIGDLYVRRYVHNGERVVCVSHKDDKE